jgi:hypothetical protein
MVALLRCRRPGFDGYALEEQLAIVGAFRRRLNKFLEAQRSYVNFLEYRTARDIRKTVKRAQDQVTAAMLCDVSGYSHRDIAKKMGIAMPERYKGNMKIPEVGALVRDGRELLDKVLETGWKERAKEMRAEGERYKSLSWEEKEIERLARRLMTCRGWTGGRQALCSEKPRGSRRMP